MSRKASKWMLKVMLAVCVLSGLLAVEAKEKPAQPAASGAVALYASDGSKLIHYDLSVDQATLTERDSVDVGGIQYGWPDPSGRHLYIAWSSGQRKGPHGVTAFDIEPGSGNLKQHGEAVPLKYRPINVTMDRDGTHLLVVSNAPPGLTVYNINPDGGIGTEVKEPDDLDLGIYVHQVRLEPSNRTAIIVARGNYKPVPLSENPEGAKTTDTGALKIFNYKDGVLTNRTSIAPGGGINFNPRHLDFDKAGKWAFVSLEAQNKLQVFALSKEGTPGSTPVFSKDTVAFPNDLLVEHEQQSGTVHMHPNGRILYVPTRAGGTIQFQGKEVFAGGENIISVFQINPKTGEPTRIQTVDTHGFVPRTFNFDSSGKILVVGNQNQRLVREGDTLKTVPANLAVFRIQPDGKLEFVRTYDLGSETKAANLLWMCIVPSSSY